MKSFSLLHSPEKVAFKAALELFLAKFMLMSFSYYYYLTHNMAITADRVANFLLEYYFQYGRVMFSRQQATKVMYL